MPINIEARTLTIGELLGGDHTFSMPAFQRPYSWEEDEAGQLYDDLHTACDGDSGDDDYFLGQLILARPSRHAPFDVIDGQQRLITLTVLLAVLRDLLPPGRQGDGLQEHILRPSNFARNQEAHVRVSLRQLDNSQFEDWIVTKGSTSVVPKAGDTDATSRIAAVVRRLTTDIGSPHASYVTKLADFILKRCYVVVVTTHTPHDAYILFRSINARGQPLTDLDIARGEFIRPHQNDASTSSRLAAAWDNIEDTIGVEQLVPAKSRFARPLLLRLNAEMLDDQIPTYFPTKVTLEHILPQRPAPRSAWHRTFPEKRRRQELSQLLGNFAILTNTANPRASNFDFHKKRETIFGAKGSNVFPLTAELVNYKDWNEESILKRHGELNKLARNILNL